MRNCYCHKRWLIFDTLGFLYCLQYTIFFSKVRDGGKWHISKESIAILVCDLRTQRVMMFQLVSIYTFPLLSRIFNFCNMNVFICIASKYFQYWIKIVLLYKLVILDFEFNYRLQRHYCQPLLQVYQSDALNTRNHIDFNFPYFLKGLIFSFWLQEYDTNLWEREKKYSCIMTCSHFCSNNYCLIDVDVLTKPTVLWIFIDLFNF